MIRRILMEFLLFLLPFALYWVYWRLIGRSAAEGSAKAHPWVLLTATGLVLVALSFVWWSISEGASPDGVYVPAHMENGDVVPGEFVTDPDAR